MQGRWDVKEDSGRGDDLDLLLAAMGLKRWN